MMMSTNNNNMIYQFVQKYELNIHVTDCSCCVHRTAKILNSSSYKNLYWHFNSVIVLSKFLNILSYLKVKYHT